MKITASIAGIAAMTVLGLYLPAHPQNARPPTVDEIVQPEGTINLRATAPSGIFYRKGQILRTVTPADRLLVIDSKNVRTLFSSYPWLQVVCFASIGRAGKAQVHTHPDTGWIYAGEVNERPVLRNRMGEVDRRLPELVKTGKLDSIKVVLERRP